MKYDLNNSPSYEHLQGTPTPAHLGSQSSSPAPAKDPGGYTETMVGASKKGKQHESGAPKGMDM